MEESTLDILSLYENIFQSTIPDQWALVNMAGLTDEEAADLINQRDKYLIKRSEQNYLLSQIEQYGSPKSES